MAKLTVMVNAKGGGLESKKNLLNYRNPWKFILLWIVFLVSVINDLDLHSDCRTL